MQVGPADWCDMRPWCRLALRRLGPLCRLDMGWSDTRHSSRLAPRRLSPPVYSGVAWAPQEVWSCGGRPSQQKRQAPAASSESSRSAWRSMAVMLPERDCTDSSQSTPTLFVAVRSKVGAPSRMAAALACQCDW